MSALLFIIAVDWVMRSTLSDENTGKWTLFNKLEDLDYADDLALLSHLETQMQRKTSNLQTNASKIGLNINIKKTEVMSLNTKSPPKIQLNGGDIKNTDYFTYLGSVVTSDGGADKDIISRLDDITRVALRWTPEGKRRKGRPKTTWRRTVEKELKEINLTWGEVEKIAKNREEWKSLVLALCASGCSKD
ncbi:uncharacterized protein LOC134250223 [Saccostrea cucullata]|uniref:uncharacterized protein LOC134250223 n=1 Tax=Saccostrea cuccullata TaxID=36930 RepID=UPI002ED4E1D4